MNKKVVIPVAIILIIAIVVGVFLFVRKDNKEPVIDNNQNTVVDNSEMANALAPIMGKDNNEVKDILDKPLDSDKQEQMDITITDIISAPGGGDVEINENGDMTYTTVDGTVVEEQFRQDIVDKSEEEIEEDFDKIMDELQAQIKNGGQSTGSSTLPNTTTTQSPTPGQTQNPEDFNTDTGNSNDTFDPNAFSQKAKEALDDQGYQGTDASKRMDPNDPNYADWVQGLVDSLEADN